VVEREREVIHVIAGHVEDATWLLSKLAGQAEPGDTDTARSELPFPSRNFH
jgi:hypothetical protein